MGSLLNIDRSIFKQLTINQLDRLENFYRENRNLYYAHKKDWHYLFNTDKFGKEYDDELMSEVNRLMQELPSMDRNIRFELKTVILNSREYYIVRAWRVLAIFDKIDGGCHVYNSAPWKSTGVTFWSNSRVGYGQTSNPDGVFYTQEYKPSEIDLKFLYEIPEFKYLDFTKLEYLNLYTLFNNRFEREHLWQIEMLIKSGYTKLATELMSSYDNIDLKLFKQHQDFFRLRGKGLYHYNRIVKLHAKGFENPEFMFVDYGYEEFWIPFLSEHPQISKTKFIQYIKGRKSTQTVFGTTFLSVYRYYIGYINKLGLDLSRDKYVFPEDLVEEFKEILLIMEFKWSTTEYKVMLMNWQKLLPDDERDPRYREEARELHLEGINEQKRKEKAEEERKKREEEKKRFLELVWQSNKHLQLEIGDDYILIAPKSADDLYVEGKTLNHCVFQYVDRIARKETAVLFVRKKKYIDKPFYTVEIRNGKVTQCRSTNNQDPAKVAEYFTEYINSHTDQISDKTMMAIA